MRPPPSFWSCLKRECAAPGGREKGAGRAPMQWPSVHTGVGVSVQASIWPCLRARLGLLRVCSYRPVPEIRWSTGCKNAFDQLLFPRVPLARKGYAASVSDRAANGCAVTTRYPGGRRGRCPHRPVAEASSTTGQRQRKEKQDVSRTSPDWKFPQGKRVSVSDYCAGQPAIPRRRQEVCAGADRPAEAFFLFGPCTARFSFGKTKREMGGALPAINIADSASNGTHSPSPLRRNPADSQEKS